MQELKAAAASLAIGLSLGLIGAGGSILTIPVFVYILKKDPLSSSIYSMFVVAISCVVGSILSFANKLVELKTVMLFGIPSVIGVLISRVVIFPSIPHQLGSIASHIISKDMLFMLCISTAMIIAGSKMLVTRKGIELQSSLEQPAASWLMARGLAVGIITGLLGIGGGFLIVPALHFLARLPMKKAIGTALVIITLNASLGFLASFDTIMVEWSLLLKFSAGSVIGILIGTRLSRRLPAPMLKRIFGWFILSIAGYIVYKQLLVD